MLSDVDVRENSEKLIDHLVQMEAFRTARTVLIYYPAHNEVDLLSLIKKYKHTKTFLFPVAHRKYMVACPYEGNEKMRRGKFNIPEPTTNPFTGKIDMVIVPGLAFDKHGNRLGRGGGYYDRYIGSLSHVSLVGVGYDFQLVNKVPTNLLDKRMNYVVTPTLGVIKTKRD